MLLGDPFVSVHIWKSSKSQLEYLKKLKESSGIEPKLGCWSVGEKQQLEENMKLYQSLNPNIDIIKLIYERKTKERSNVFKTTCFWEILAFNLCRILDHIYASLAHHFRGKAGYKTGVFSKQEHLRLKELVKKHGKDWVFISNLMNRNTNILSTVYHGSVKNNINSGPWKKYEKEKLFYIAKRLIEYNQRYCSSLYKINYRIVSDFVKTRNANACKRFVRSHKALLETSLVQNDFNLLLKETTVLYVYFSKVQSRNEIDIKELFLLFGGKFTENELNEKLIKIVPVLTNDNLVEKLKSTFEKEIQAAGVLFKQINFSNVLLTMKRPRTIAWLKAKYYLLVHENISEHENKTSEEIITVLHKEYCSEKTFTEKQDTSCFIDSNETSINSGINKTTSSIDLVSDDEDDLVDLTLISDDDSIFDIDHNDEACDFDRNEGVIVD